MEALPPRRGGVLPAEALPPRRGGVLDFRRTSDSVEARYATWKKTHMSVHRFISNTTKPHTFHNGNGKKPYVSVKRFEPHGKKAYVSNCRTYAFLPLLSAAFQ